MTNSDHNLIAVFAAKVERILGMEPGSVEKMYQGLVDMGHMTVDEALVLLHTHHSKLEVWEVSRS